MHSLYNELADLAKDEKVKEKKEALSLLAKKTLELDKIWIDRLYIAQCAAAEGWRFANDVEFYQSGWIYPFPASSNLSSFS